MIQGLVIKKIITVVIKQIMKKSEMRKLIKQQVVFIHQLNSIAPTYVNINPNLELDEDNWYQNPQFEEYFPEISYAAIEAQNTSIIPLSLTMAKKTNKLITPKKM